MVSLIFGARSKDMEKTTISNIIGFLDPNKKIRIRYKTGIVYTGSIKGIERSKNREALKEVITKDRIVLMEVENGILTFRLRFG